jgi:hypothetical protein
MGKASRRRRTPSADVSPTMLKGRLVELIVGDMHSTEGVTVQRNVRLPVKHTTRVREIDVLITSVIAGYPVRLAIECKNYGRVIDAPDIDAFVGKLDDVGLPTQHGIYVTTRLFSKGALERAEKAGIRPLILTGLTKDRVAAAVREATQTVVFLLPVVTQVSVINDMPQVQEFSRLLIFFDGERPIAYIQDLIWDKWRKGEIPREVGPHTIPITIPEGWFQILDGRRVVPSSISVELTVYGAALTRRGEASEHALVHAARNSPEKLRIIAKFPPPSSERQPLTLFDSETDLAKFLDAQPGIVRHVGRVTLPRIRYGPIYWPPSDRIARTLHIIEQEYVAGRLPEPTPKSLDSLEGENINAVWEPISPGHIFPPKQDTPSDADDAG